MENTDKPIDTQRGGKGEFEDFKNFLHDELKGVGASSSRRVVAVTPGLGLDSPKKHKEMSGAPTPSFGTEQIAFEGSEDLEEVLHEAAPKVETKVTPPKVSVKPPVMKTSAPEATKFDFEQNEKSKSRSEMSLATVMDTPHLPSTSEEKFETRRERETERPVSREKRSVKPPPLPSPSAVRRLFASLMDQMFVLTFFTFALVLTANLMDGFSTGFSLKVFQNFSNPAFVRLATLEFAVLWVLYFGIGVGVLDATFGMWVWGVRVSYGPKGDSGYALRKAMRVFWSVLFFAPVVPMFLLAIKRRGRNLLDTLSGSNLYLSPQ